MSCESHFKQRASEHKSRCQSATPQLLLSEQLRQEGLFVRQLIPDTLDVGAGIKTAGILEAHKNPATDENGHLLRRSLIHVYAKDTCARDIAGDRSQCCLRILLDERITKDGASGEALHH
jgi:hypothetical protein